MKKYNFEFISMVLSEYQKEKNIKIIKQIFDISIDIRIRIIHTFCRKNPYF